MSWPNNKGNEASYYAILNIAQDASSDDIKKAYRALAQVFHPDKHTSDSLRETATDSFSKIQEAYEILSDPHKRQIYDVYGKQGLAAGFEIGDKLKSQDELRKEWEEFQKKQKQDQQDQLSSHKGVYICRFDGTPLMHGMPVNYQPIRSVVVQNTIETPIAEDDALTIQGQAVLRGGQGAGSIMFGYRRRLTLSDALEASLSIGLRSFASISSTRQLDPYSSASITATWSQGEGIGMQVSTSRQLSTAATGTVTWVLGPPSSTGLNLSVTHRGAKHVVVVKLELGVVTSISLRLNYTLMNDVIARAIARAGTSGIDMEVGCTNRWSPTAAGYIGAVVGLQGVSLKLRLTRMGHTFEFPVLISTQYTDIRAVAAVYLLPPLVTFCSTRYIARPLAAWMKKRKETKEALQYRKEVQAAVSAAAAEQALLLAVARRKARAEAERNGLVILEAAYGILDTYFSEYQLRPVVTDGISNSIAGASGSAVHTAEDYTRVNGDVNVASSSTAANENAHDEGQINASVPDSEENAGGKEDAGTRDGGASAEPSRKDESVYPIDGAQWLLVTPAMQYLVVDGQLLIHAVPTRAGLMGFTDPAPNSLKQLYIAYWHRGTVWQVTLDDTSQVEIPGTGEAVPDPTLASLLLARAQYLYGVDLPVHTTYHAS